MQSFKRLIKKFNDMSGYSKTAVKMGALMMVCFYIVGITAYIIAPHVPNYFGAISVFRGSLEAAPASLVSGLCAGIICDITLKSKKSGDGPENK